MEAFAVDTPGYRPGKEEARYRSWQDVQFRMQDFRGDHAVVSHQAYVDEA